MVADINFIPLLRQCCGDAFEMVLWFPGMFPSDLVSGSTLSRLHGTAINCRTSAGEVWAVPITELLHYRS